MSPRLKEELKDGREARRVDGGDKDVEVRHAVAVCKGSEAAGPVSESPRLDVNVVLRQVVRASSWCRSHPRIRIIRPGRRRQRERRQAVLEQVEQEVVEGGAARIVEIPAERPDHRKDVRQVDDSNEVVGLQDVRALALAAGGSPLCLLHLGVNARRSSWGRARSGRWCGRCGGCRCRWGRRRGPLLGLFGFLIPFPASATELAKRVGVNSKCSVLRPVRLRPPLSRLLLRRLGRSCHTVRAPDTVLWREHGDEHICTQGKRS